MSGVAAFERAIQAFEQLKADASKGWPVIFSAFNVAFKAARQDRAAYTPRLNILDVFGLKTRELCHSRVLAWFLDENATHEQGNVFMQTLLRRIGLNVLECNNYRVQREKPDRVDVVAYKKGVFAVFIENKVEHHERELQLADLQDSLIAFSNDEKIPESHRVAVFLTDDGRRPKTAHTSPLEGFLKEKLHTIRRFNLFDAFRDSLIAQSQKSVLLLAFLNTYVDAVATHGGSRR